MNSSNAVSIEIPPAVLADIHALINQAGQLLQPYLIALTPVERRELPKMADKTLSFVSKSLQFAESNPEFAPAYLDIPALHIDVKSVQDLTSLEKPLEILASKLNDTIMVAGSEAYVAGLTYYQSTKVAAKRAVPGAMVIYDDLRVRFDKTKKKETAVNGVKTL